METTFKVRVWQIRPKTGAARKDGKPPKKSYTVRWFVADNPWSETYSTRPLADSFRSTLIAAQKAGEAFRIADGLPVSVGRTTVQMSWFVAAQTYVDAKWPRAAAKSRAGNADTMATVTMALLATTSGMPPAKVLRRAMTGWAFNTKARDTAMPHDIERAIRWLSANTMPVARLGEIATTRRAIDQLALKMDGKPAAAKTVSRKRSVFYNFLEYAVESDLVSTNRLRGMKWTAPKEVSAIDKRVVVNPQQATRLLKAVEAQKIEGQPRRSHGPMLKAYFATMYYAGCRPEEVVMLSKDDLHLPEHGWGELLLSKTAPTAGSAWTDSGERRDRRQLKQRGVGEVRHVPCVPPLTEILHAHINRHGVGTDGRLFRGLGGKEMSDHTVARVWDRARKAALTEREYASVLAKRPYDLRHACVSTWLAAGVPSTQVAEWAGHSVAVLHQIYAKVIAGTETSSLDRIGQALGLPPAATERDQEDPSDPEEEAS